MDAEKAMEELLEIDSLGILLSMSDEQIEAVRMAYRVLKYPESATCGYCQRITDELSVGEGWCEQHDRKAFCNAPACPHYE